MGKGADPTAIAAQHPPSGNGGRRAEEGELLPKVEMQTEQRTPFGTNLKIWHLQKKIDRIHLLAVIAILVIAIIALASSIGVLMGNECTDHPTTAVDGIPELVKDVEPPCAEGWIWHQDKCYFFSEDEGNWTAANDTCASLQSSLAVIDSKQELDFMMRYKGVYDHWIGLQKGADGLWRWPDGSEFNKLFEIHEASTCAYLNHNGATSARCYNERKWICTKRTEYVKKIMKRSVNVALFLY